MPRSQCPVSTTVSVGSQTLPLRLGTGSSAYLPAKRQRWRHRHRPALQPRRRPGNRVLSDFSFLYFPLRVKWKRVNGIRICWSLISHDIHQNLHQLCENIIFKNRLGGKKKKRKAAKAPLIEVAYSTTAGDTTPVPAGTSFSLCLLEPLRPAHLLRWTPGWPGPPARLPAGGPSRPPPADLGPASRRPWPHF